MKTTTKKPPVKLVLSPKPDTKKPDTKKPDTKKLDTKKLDTKKLDTKKLDTKKLDTKKPDVLKAPAVPRWSLEALAKKLGIYIAPGAVIKAWSYSTYTQYIQCPLSVAFEKVLKIRIEETPSEAMLRGTAMHKAAELYVKALEKPRITPDELKPIAQLVETLRRKKAQAELEWAFDINWNPVSWFASNAWLRMKIDAMLQQKTPPEVAIVDYKSGRVHIEHAQQRSLYGIGGLRLVQIGQLAGGAKTTKLTAQHVYTDTGQKAVEEFSLSQLASLQKEWMARTKDMLTDTTFKPVPHTARANSKPYCRWCKFRKSNGGPCPEDM